MAYQNMIRVFNLTGIFILFITSVAIAQDNNSAIEDRSEDMFREMKTGELTLRFINAMNGEHVQGATVFIAGEEYRTDYEGRVLFEPPTENGLVSVRFEKEDFITAEFDLELMLGTIFQNRVSVSPILRPESIRIVLDWGDRPRDLDAHLTKAGDYHISYRHKRVSDDGTAKLDRDDTNGNGPETITVNQVDDRNTYTYKVHNFSDRRDDDSRSLANEAKAVVRVYGDNRLMGQYRVGKNRSGTEWTVFQIKDGQIITVDALD